MLFVLCHLYRIDAPPNGHHAWREAQTATVAALYDREDLNPLTPRVHNRGAQIGITGMELPAYSWTGGLLTRLFGGTNFWLHLLTILSGTLGLWFLYRIVGWMIDETAGAMAAWAMAFSPLYFYYGFKLIPDVTMLALTLGAFWLYLRHLETGAIWRLIVAAVLLAAAGAIKPLALAILLPLLLCAWRRSPRPIFHSARLLIVAVVVTAAAALWIQYALSLSSRYLLWPFEMRSHLDRLPEMLGSGLFVRRLVLQWPWDLWVGWVLVPAFAYGLVRIFRERRALIPISWIAAAYIVFLLTALKSTSHDYYTLVITPALAVITGVGLSRLFATGGWRRAVAVALIALAPATAAIRIAHRFGPTDEYYSLRAGAAALIPPEQLVVVEDWTPIVRLYALDRFGWTVPPNSNSVDSIVAYIRGGAQWLLLQNPAGITGNFPDGIQLSPAGSVGPLHAFRVDRAADNR